MKWLLLLLLSVLACPAAAQAPAAPPIVRTWLDPASGAVIGQPIALNVEVMFPGEMGHPPAVNVGAAPGAQIMRFETQALTIRDRIDGRDYVGQRFAFTVFPRRGGSIEVPAAEVTLLDPGGDPIGNASGKPIAFEVTVPPGIDPSGPVIASTEVRVRQEWTPDPAGAFKVGGAIKRVIHRQAADVPALGMADYAFSAPEGVRVYADPPKVEDRTNRGSVEGIRTDIVTYVFERPGAYRLPSLAQPWWNLSTREVRTETMEGISITAAATPIRPRKQGARGWVSRFGPMGLAFAAALLALLAAMAWFPRLVALRRRHRETYLSGPDHAREELRRVARHGKAEETYAALERWLRRLTADERAAARAHRQLGPLIARLEADVFGSRSGWSREYGAEFSQALSKSALKRDGLERMSVGPLPPLNPSPIGRP